MRLSQIGSLFFYVFRPLSLCFPAFGRLGLLFFWACWLFLQGGLLAFFAGGLTPPPCTPRRPLRRGCLFLLACVISACLVVMCRNSAPSSAFSGERGTGIAPRLPHPGDDTPPDPLAPQLRLVATLGLGGILCVSAPPLSSITLFIKQPPTHKKTPYCDNGAVQYLAFFEICHLSAHKNRRTATTERYSTSLFLKEDGGLGEGENFFFS